MLNISIRLPELLLQEADMRAADTSAHFIQCTFGA